MLGQHARQNSTPQVRVGLMTVEVVFAAAGWKIVRTSLTIVTEDSHIPNMEVGPMSKIRQKLASLFSSRRNSRRNTWDDFTSPSDDQAGTAYEAEQDGSTATLDAESDHAAEPIEVPVEEANGLVESDRNRNANYTDLPAASSSRKPYQQVTDTLHALRQHMARQNERADRMMEMLEGLPEVLKSIPETTRTQTQILQAIQGQLQSNEQTSTQLSSSLNSLAQATAQQEQAMGQLFDQLEHSRQNSSNLKQGLDDLSETLLEVGQTQQRSTELLETVSTKNQDHTDTLQQLVARHQRQNTIMTIISWTLAIVSLGVAGYVAIVVSQVAGG